LDAFPNVARALILALDGYRDVVVAFMGLSLNEKIVFIEGTNMPVLVKISLSLLLSPFPVQVALPKNACMLLALLAFPPYASAFSQFPGFFTSLRLGPLLPPEQDVDYYLDAAATTTPLQDDIHTVTQLFLLVETIKRDIKPRVDIGPLTASHEDYRLFYSLRDGDTARRLFPYKHLDVAVKKANVHLNKVVLSTAKQAVYQHDYAVALSLALKAGLTNDEACSMLLYLATLLANNFPKPAALAVAAASDKVGGKALTNSIKALGLARYPEGAILCETPSLLGRGVGDIDLEAIAVERCNRERVEAMVAHFPLERLEHALREIIDEELEGRQVRYTSLEEHWSRRWAWCVNGSHAPELDRSLAKARVKGISRWYRRMWAEDEAESPVIGWDGETFVSASKKHEHGKTRAIFSCDSRSYVAFEHLLKPIEHAWRQRRAILNPGEMGHLGLCQRITGFQRAGGTNVMLDFDDFNSQHSNAAMQAAIRIAGEKVGYPPHLLAPLLASFDNMYVYVAGNEVGRLEGTLMSGHRATTFLNTLLNAAYVRVAAGPEAYNAANALHVGDDVYLSCASSASVRPILDNLHANRARLNPAKQSVGHVSAEFLRMCITGEGARGYAPRAIASAVSGSWVSTTILDPAERLQSAVTFSRSLINRCNSTQPSLMLLHSIAAVTGFKLTVIRSILLGTASLNNGPVYTYVPQALVHTVVPPMYTRKRLLSLPAQATDSFLHHHATPIEIAAFGLVGHTVRPAMISASYSKLLFQSREPLSSARLLTKRLRLRGGSANANTLARTRPAKGVLSPYPLLNFLRNALTDTWLLTLLTELGLSPAPSQLQEVAWGPEAYPCLIRGVLSYSDAASYSRRTQAGVIVSPYPVYV